MTDRTDMHIDDVAPKRTHDFGDLTRAALSLVGAVIVMVFAVYMGGITSGVEADVHTAAQAINWLADIPSSVLQQLATVIIVVTVLIQLMLAREWLVTLTAIAGMLAGYLAAWGLSILICTTNRMLAISVVSATTLLDSGLLPGIYTAMAAFLTTAGPRRIRSSVKWGWNILYATAALMVMLSWHSVSGVLVAFFAGRALGMIVRFAVGTRSTGIWGEELVNALQDIGLDVATLTRNQELHARVRSLNASLDDDLVEGSRIYDMRTTSGKRYVVSVLDAQTHTAGYLKQLWDWLRFTGIATRRDRNVCDTVQHHFAMLLALSAAGLPAMAPYGVADTEESAVLVLDAHTGERPTNLNILTRDDAVEYMRFLDVANRRGYTHRRITPDTLARLDGGIPVIAGWHNGDSGSSGANIALDKVQLLALFAALIGVDDALNAACEVWGEQTLLQIAPFLQKVAIPSPTRALDSWDKQLLKTLQTSITAMADDEQNDVPESVTLARFSWRSMLTMLLVIVAVVVVFTQLKPEEIVAALRNANPTMALICLAFGLCSWIGSSVSLGALVERGKRRPLGIFMSQVAGGFATVSMPAGVGPAFVNLQFLRKSGYRNTTATAIMSAVMAVYYLAYFMLLIAIGLFTGKHTLSGTIPTNTLVIVLGAVGAVLAIAMMIPPLRHMIMQRLVPVAKKYFTQLLNVLNQPAELAVSICGGLVQNITTGLAFWSALLAFGVHMNPVETIFVFMLAYALGSAVPTPGGLGGVEAALTFAFVAVGVPQGVALSATLLHRVVFYWLRIPLGALAMQWLNRHNLV